MWHRSHPTVRPYRVRPARSRGCFLIFIIPFLSLFHPLHLHHLPLPVAAWPGAGSSLLPGALLGWLCCRSAFLSQGCLGTEPGFPLATPSEAPRDLSRSLHPVLSAPAGGSALGSLTGGGGGHRPAALSVPCPHTLVPQLCQRGGDTHAGFAHPSDETGHRG